MKNREKSAENSPKMEQAKPRSRHAMAKNAAKGLLAVSTIVTAAASEAMILTHEGNPMTAIHKYADTVTGKDNSRKVTATPRPSLAQAKISANPITIPNKDFCPPAPSEARREEIRQSIEAAVTRPEAAEARSQAEARGLHFADPNETFTKVAAAQNSVDATAAVSEFTEANYGFSVSADFRSGMLSSAGLDVYKGKLDLMTLMIGTLPEELLRGSNVSSIHIKPLLNEVPNSNGLRAAGTYNSSGENLGHGTVDLEMDYIDHPFVFIHEVIGHGINNSVCQGYMQNDTGYTQFNPTGFSYTDGNDPSPEYTASVAASNYGTTNSMEDEAELTRTFITGEDLARGKTYAPGDPKTDKLAVLLDRIDNIAPGSVDYLAEMRPTFSHLQALAWTT